MPATAGVIALATTTALINAVSAANTAAATSSGVDLTGYEGVVNVIQNLGTLGGSHAGKVQGSTDNSTWNDLISGGSFAVNTANTVSVISLDTRKVMTLVSSVPTNCRYIRYVGTVTTGPSLISIQMTGFKKVMP